MKKNTSVFLILLWINIGSIHSLTVRPLASKLVPRIDAGTTKRHSSLIDARVSSSMQRNKSSHKIPTTNSAIQDSIVPIGSAALLITSNTVGAGMMTLPELASGPGLLATSGLMFGTYLLNLISGLLIAEVSINQYESSNGSWKKNVPSSFKELTDVNFESLYIGTFVSAVSM
jgi:hypothetical protein